LRKLGEGEVTTVKKIYVIGTGKRGFQRESSSLGAGGRGYWSLPEALQNKKERGQFAKAPRENKGAPSDLGRPKFGGLGDINYTRTGKRNRGKIETAGVDLMFTGGRTKFKGSGT